MFKYYNFVFSGLFLFLLGCSDSDESINIDYSNLKVSILKDAPLSEPSNADFERYIKNGIRLRFTQQNYPIDLAETADDGNVISHFSTTNVHEIGVDEADRLKYDGEYLYQVNHANFATNEGSTVNSIRILKTSPSNATAEFVTEIVNDSDQLAISDIFLRAQNNQLIAVKNTLFYTWNDILLDNDWQWISGKTQIQLYDVQIPEDPGELWKIEIEGNLEGSRRIDNMLYLVTRYVPNIIDINYSANNDDERKSNERLILDTPISDLLPHFQTNDGAIRSLVSAQDCLVGQGSENIEGYADILTLSAINLDTLQVTDSICLNANVNGIYSSTSGFYIGGSSSTGWFEFSSFTAIHKFKLESDSIEYRASTSLPGHLGWNDPSFRMSEYENDLRIVTTDFNQTTGNLEHRLSILREDDSNQLQTISSLPNTANPEPIGKPGEDIFAVRFAGERGYIVTYERIDPLYVIDLSSPENPSIVAELEIPGFSRYLHPLSDDWLLGIGTEVNDEGLQGVKVELYDIRNMSVPVVKNKLVFGQASSYTEATTDLRSISLLNVNEQQKRLAFPINIWQQQSASSFSQWQESGLFLFEINTAVNDGEDTNEMNLEFSGKMIIESVNENQSYPLNSWLGRSKLHDGAVFYLHGNQVFSSVWGQWEQRNGPF